MHHEAARRFAMGDAAEALHSTLPRVETHATTRSVKISTEAATNRASSKSLSTIFMTVDKILRHEAAHRFAMDDVAEAPNPTLPRAATHATKISVEISTTEASTNSTDSPSLPTIVMTADEKYRHESARQVSSGNVMKAAPLPTLPRLATVQPKKTNAPLNTRKTLTANAVADNTAAAATADISATSNFYDDDHDHFKGMTEKKRSNYLRNYGSYKRKRRGWRKSKHSTLSKPKEDENKKFSTLPWNVSYSCHFKRISLLYLWGVS